MGMGVFLDLGEKSPSISCESYLFYSLTEKSPLIF